MELTGLQTREVGQLSGGELQRFAIAIASVRQADIYMFDEPSSYLDIRQRLAAARVIRNLVQPTNYVVVVEHDLSTLDYLSDFICVFYGVPGMYGVVTMPFSVREGEWRYVFTTNTQVSTSSLTEWSLPRIFDSERNH